MLAPMTAIGRVLVSGLVHGVDVFFLGGRVKLKGFLMGMSLEE
jgi:hypothetical protein